MRVPSRLGSPITTLDRLVLRASNIGSNCASGTNMRRIAVHFCPALVVISRKTSFAKRSNSTVPGCTSGPRSDAFRLSCSAINRVAFCRISGAERSISAVSAEPVKLITSCEVTWRSMLPRLPETSCKAPSGKSPLSRISRTQSSVT